MFPFVGRGMQVSTKGQAGGCSHDATPRSHQPPKYSRQNNPRKEEGWGWHGRGEDYDTNEEDLLTVGPVNLGIELPKKPKRRVFSNFDPAPVLLPAPIRPSPHPSSPALPVRGLSSALVTTAQTAESRFAILSGNGD